MKPLRYLLACLFMVCITILIFALMNQGTLCELTIRSGSQEVAAKLACRGFLARLARSRGLNAPNPFTRHCIYSRWHFNIHVMLLMYIIYKLTQCNKPNINYIGFSVLI